MQTQQRSVTNSSHGRILVKIWAKYRRISGKYWQNSSIQQEIPIEDCFVTIDYDDSQLQQ